MSGSPREIFSAGYALAYREARRELEDQERLVGELRGRAGTLIAAAAIATSVTTCRFGTLLLVVEVLAWVVALVAGVD